MISYGPRKIESAIGTERSEDWLLVWNLDATGSIYSMLRPTVVAASAPGCNAYTYAQLTAYKSGTWSEVMLTSRLNPHVRWIMNKAANATNLPLFMQTILTGGNPGTYMTINLNYTITLDLTKSSVPNSGGNPYCFMHNNNGSEPGDIPTLGVNGTVWSTGMFWGCIDAFTNYGGLLNTTTAVVGNVGGATGDRLLVYVR